MKIKAAATSHVLLICHRNKTVTFSKEEDRAQEIFSAKYK